MNKKKYLKITLISLSLGAALSIDTKEQVSADNIPIINPTNPEQIIIPKEDDYVITPAQTFTNESTEKDTYNDIQNKKENTDNTIKKNYRLNKIAAPYQHTKPKQTRKHQIDKYYSPAALPSYQFDVVSGGNDDFDIPSTTGLMMASISGSMIMGI